jgi:putative ABC transport system substrate-binding protein
MKTGIGDTSGMFVIRNFVICAGIGAILAVSPSAAAQQTEKFYRIGYLTASTAKAVKSRLDAFRRGMRALDYVEGRSFVIEQRHANGRRKILPSLATQLVDMKVDVIVTNGGTSTLAADRASRQASKRIPVVFALAADPVGTGLVASLSRPGGNITGLSNSHGILVPKRLALLKELMPGARRVAVLWSPRTKNGPPQLNELQDVAARLGVTLIPVALENREDLDKAFGDIEAAGADALNVFSWSLSGRLRKQIAKAAIAIRLPTIHASPRNVVAGGLMGYGVNRLDLYRRAARYVDKIFKGAKPSELPVELPTKFELVVNLKTANALGITVPPSILLRATEVFE